MLRSRFLWKLYAGYVALVVGTSLLAGILTAHYAEDYGRDQLDRELSNHAALLGEVARPALVAGRGHELQDRVDTLGKRIRVRLTVVRPDGRVVADSWQDPALMDDHSNRPELIAARESGSGHAMRYSVTTEQDMLYQARSIVVDGRLLGLSRAALSLDRVHRELGALRWAVVLAGGMAALAGLPLGLFFARRVTEPLTRMTQVATQLAAGELDQRFEERRSDEIGQLATAINTMAQELAQRVETTESERNQLETVLTSMDEGLVAIDAQERVTMINHHALELFGLRGSTEQILGRKLWELVRMDGISDAVTGALTTGEPVQSEQQITGRGLDRHIDLHSAPIRDADGAVTGAVVVFHDITELRRLETVRRDFVANISHELKTPLTAIRGMVETVLDDPEMPPELRQRFLGRVLTQGERLSDLVADLLTLSRIESTQSAMDLQQVPLRSVVRISCDHLRERAEDKAVTLEVDLCEDELRVDGDQEFLRQVTDNLVDNAIKYTPAGGRANVTLTRDGDRAVITVRDTGIGIAPGDQARVFERFYRVDKARSRELGSTGLGLSIVKHIVLAHGGQLTLDSNLGEGSTFTVRLPLAGTG